MKSCEFRTSEASTKSWFRSKGIIDKYLNITDLGKFRKETKKWSLKARSEYGIEGWLFDEEDNGRKAVPNSHMFHQIDKAKGIKHKGNNYLYEGEVITAKDINDLVEAKADFFSPTYKTIKTSKVQTNDEFNNNFKNNSSLLFGGLPSNLPTQEVLLNIAQSTVVKDPYVNELLEKLAVQAKSKVKIIENKDLPNKDTFMYFESKNGVDTIYVSKDKLGNVSSDVAATKFIHEALHARTYRVINMPKNVVERDLVGKLTDSFNNAKNTLDGFEHELSNLDEFVAGMFSNPEFSTSVQNTLGNGFWDKLKNFFLKLFGSSTESAPQIMDNILKLVDVSEEVSNPLDIMRESKDPKNYREIKKDFDVNKLEKTSDNIVKLLNTFFNISSRTNSTYNANIGEIITTLSELKEKYKDNEDVYNTLAVAKYVKFMNNQMTSFKKRLDDPDLEFSAGLYNQMQNYLSSFGLINEIFELNKDLKFSGVLDEKKFKQYDSALKDVIKLFDDNKSTLNVLAKNFLIDNFASPEYFKEEYLRYRDFFADEARKIYPGKENKAKRTSYVNNKLAENRDKIANRTKDRFKELIENSKEDISKIASQINSEKAINNSIIQILTKALDKNELEYKNEIFPKLRQMQDQYDAFIQGKKNKSSDKVFSKFVETGSNGRKFLKGEYSVKFIDKMESLKNAVADALEEHGEISKEYRNAVAAKKRWFKLNTTKLGRGRYIPKSKWLNDFSKLTDKERDYYEHIKRVARQANDNTNGVKSLKKMYYEAEYFQLPSIRKSTLTKLQSGQLTSGLKEQLKDAWTRQADEDMEGELVDAELQKVYTDLSGKEINYIPIHYRGLLDPEQQSIDLSTIYAMELENSIKFKHRSTIHADLDLFIDVLKQSDFTKKVGFSGKVMTSLFSKDGADPVKISGEDANIIKLAETMMKNRMYDKLSEYAGKIGPVDANKAVGQMLGFTSQLGMALNYFGATANFAIGNVNNMIESFAGDVINRGNIANALKMYSSNVPSLMKDVGKTANNSLINQILDRYNVFGDVRNLKQEFEKNNKLKALFKGDTFQFMHNVGEHGMQAVLTLAVLDNIKILNKDGKYLGLDGKVVPEDKAVSLREVYTLDVKGNLTTKIPVTYTTVDNLNTWKKGGEANVRGVVKQLIFRNHGQYDSRLQSEFQRHWFGKMVMMYKKHIELPMLNRTRGLATSFKKRENLTEKELKYNYDLNKIDEGHYTSMVRFIRRNVIPNLKALKLKLIMTDFQSLDEWEKANLRRTMAEASMMGMFMALAQVIAAAAGDDDEAMWFAAYTFRRMQSDLAQYHNPNEAWRILKNPFASLRQIELITEVAETVFSPWSWGEEYQGGPYKGESIFKRKLVKLTPVLTRKDLSSKQAFSFIDR